MSDSIGHALNRQKIFDTELELHRSCNIATDGTAGHIAGTAATVDIGGGYTEGYFIVNVTTLTKPIAGAWYDIQLQGAMDASFASTVMLASVVVGDAGLPNRFITEDASTDVYVRPWSNKYGANIYRHVRAYVNMGGTPGTGVTFSAFLSK